MYTRRMDTKSGLFTPQSTPLKRHEDHHSSSGTSRGYIVPSQRRLPRKPARPLSIVSNLVETEKKYLLNHPVDFIMNILIQTLHQHLYLDLLIITRHCQEWRLSLVIQWIATTSLSVIVTLMMTALNVDPRIQFWTVCALSCLEVLAIYSDSSSIMNPMRYLWRLPWNKVVLLCWKFFRGLVRAELLEQDVVPSQCIDVARTEYRRATRLSPCSRKNAYLLSNRTPRPIAPGSLPPPAPEMPQSFADSTRARLGHRVEELHRILADCNRAQLEAAGRLVYGLHARAQARAGWKN